MLRSVIAAASAVQDWSTEFEDKEQEESDISLMLFEVLDVVLKVCDIFGFVQFELKEQEESELSFMLSEVIDVV